jgi:integrase
MTHGRLTVKKIEAAVRAGKWVRLADGHGLILEIGSRRTAKSRAASWILRWERDRRDHYFGLGPYDDVSLAEARERAKEVRKLIWQGIDPAEDRRAKREAAALAAARTRSFGWCCEQYYKSREAAWSASHAKQWSGQMLGIINGRPVKADDAKPLRSLPVADIDVPMLVGIVTPLWHTKRVTASRLLNRVGSVIDMATAMKLRSGDNPAKVLVDSRLMPARPKGEVQAHYAALPYADLPPLMVQLRARRGVDARCLEFAILCAARPAEALGARWDEITGLDGDSPLWTIPAQRMKGKKPHVVPLSPDAAALIRSMVPEAGDPHLFVGSRAQRGLSSSAVLKLLRRKLREPVITPHGFRSTFSSWANETTSFKPDVVEACLSHIAPGSTAVSRAYNRSEHLAARRRLLEAWARHCAAPAIPAAADNVRPIRGGVGR